MTKKVNNVQYQTTENRLYYTGGNHAFFNGEHALVIEALNHSTRPDTEFVLESLEPFSSTLLLNPTAIMTGDIIIHIGEPREIKVVEDAYDVIEFDDYTVAKVILPS